MTEPSAVPPLQSQPLRVVVTDIDMPMADIVRFMVRWAVASIPALIILAVIGVVIGVALGALASILTLISSATRL
jgi:hypothetical protein